MDNPRNISPDLDYDNTRIIRDCVELENIKMPFKIDLWLAT
jgi:hypothetical protein